MSGAERLDQHLVSSGLARSRTLAQRLIKAGSVQVSGQVIDKPSYAVGPGQQVTLTSDPESHYVGRGALKLLHALAVWAPDLRTQGRRCLDIGASTGGFTQVLLEHGASHVTALDVGHGQLVAEVAADPRVRDLPGTNIRDVGPAELGRFDLIVTDVSFISLAHVLPTAATLLAPGADLVALVKPQFEVGRERLGHGGVVTSASERARVLHEVVDVASGLGLSVGGLERSPVTGSRGNHEYLLWLRTGSPGMMWADDEMAARIQTLTQEDD